MILRDWVAPPSVQQILTGERLFRPYLSYQKRWMKYFYPEDDFDVAKSSWYYLQKYMLPLIEESASSYHKQGLELLALKCEDKPDFSDFQKKFASVANGFTVIKARSEIPPKEYFTLILNKQFPCVVSMRPVSGVFCTNAPDFWHEAMGHLTALCANEIQEIYQEYAAFVLSAKSNHEFNQRMAVAWTLMEYGFIKEAGQTKMFGAALVGSHLAHMRYRANLISIESCSQEAIIESRFYNESGVFAKTPEGKFRFFTLP